MNVQFSLRTLLLAMFFIAVPLSLITISHRTRLLIDRTNRFAADHRLMRHFDSNTIRVDHLPFPKHLLNYRCFSPHGAHIHVVLPNGFAEEMVLSRGVPRGWSCLEVNDLVEEHGQKFLEVRIFADGAIYDIGRVQLAAPVAKSAPKFQPPRTWITLQGFVGRPAIYLVP